MWPQSHHACLAIEPTQLHMVQEYLNPRDKTNNGSTPLHFAVLTGNLPLIDYLIGCNKNLVNEANFKGETPLHWSCSSSNYELIEYLISLGADISQEDNDGNSPIHWACQSGNLEAVMVLTDMDCNVNCLNELGQSPIMLACIFGNSEVVEFLLPWAKLDEDLLHIACENDQHEILEMLLSKKIFVVHKESDDSPLLTAKTMNRPDCIEVLMKYIE